MVHTPVLTKEVLQYLDLKPNENFIDGTVGQAGHTILLLEKNGPKGKVLGIDLDTSLLENAKSRLDNFKSRVILVHDSYVHIKKIAEKIDFKPVHGILLDLGYSSWQIEDSTKGFSFKKDEKLDMRYDVNNPLTAEKIVNQYPESQIQRILKDYGQEKFAKKIAREIVRQRNIKNIESTFQVKEIIEKVVPKKLQHRRIHCATKTFQALRIAVNNELDNLANVLPDAISMLSPKGRLVVISFHSLEDSIVKNFFRDQKKEGIVTIATPKPIIASYQELLVNQKSRSAKLRAIVKNY